MTNYTTYEIAIMDKARVYAHAAHAAVGQKRKYTGVAYIGHPANVANLVKGIGGTAEQVAAAWLHDVVEDTKVTLVEISDMFGSTVSEYVDWLTDITTKEDGNRAQRKMKDYLRWRKAPCQAKTIKLADVIDNTSSIVEFDPDFAKVYMQEKERLVWTLRDGDHTLLCQAMKQIEDYKMNIAEAASNDAAR